AGQESEDRRRAQRDLREAQRRDDGEAQRYRRRRQEDAGGSGRGLPQGERPDLIANRLMAERERATAAAFADLSAFVHGLRFGRLREEVAASAGRSLPDLPGVAAAGSRTRAAAIASAYAATQLCGNERNARILFDARRAGLAGAAFAGATTIDS